MPTDLRSMLKGAAEDDWEPLELGALVREAHVRKRRRRMMEGLGVLAAILIVAFAASAVIRAIAVQEVNTAGDPQNTEDTRDAPSEGESAPPRGSLPRSGGQRAPGGLEAAGTGAGGGGAAPVDAGEVNCDPLITDPKGDTRTTDNPDTDNPAIDILEASMTYDASRNRLVVREVFDDIPDNPPGRNQALYYTFWFTLDGTRYKVEAYIGAPTGYQWEFYVHRARRDGSTLNLPVMLPTGRVDTQADTVTIEIDVDEFNRGERRVSDEEGLRPAAELRRGSTLKKIYMEAYPVEAGIVIASDDAHAGCDYVVPGS